MLRLIVIHLYLHISKKGTLYLLTSKSERYIVKIEHTPLKRVGQKSQMFVKTVLSLDKLH